MNTKDELESQRLARIAELRGRRVDLRKRYMVLKDELKKIDGELGEIGDELHDLVSVPQEYHEGRMK